MFGLPAPVAAPPNVVVIFCDDAGYGDFGFTGNPVIRTPHIDRMAREGKVMTQFYSASPACTASRYGILTGREPARSGFAWVLYPTSPRYLHPEETTIAELLKERGYATGIFGKWHLGFPNENNGETELSLPLAHGFDSWLGYGYSNDMREETGHPPLDLIRGDIGIGYSVAEHDSDQAGITTRLTDRTIEFIQENRDRPFLAYVPYPMPHIPLFPSERHLGSSLRGRYGDVIEEIDANVGRILDEVRRLDLSDNTLVVFTSDNGPWILKGRAGGSSGPFRDGKGSTWEGGMREPCVFWWPGRISPGRSAELSSTLDLLPSIARLAGARSAPVDGRSLAALGGGPTDGRYFYYYGPGNVMQAVRDDRWKLHIATNSQIGETYFDDPMPLLFDLLSDPGETQNLAAERPETVARLSEVIERRKSEIALDGNYWD